MYRLGLGRDRIAAVVRAAPATVGYHLGIARRQDPELEAAHIAAGAPLSPAAVARMEEVIAWVAGAGRLPRGRATDQAERSTERLDQAASQGGSRRDTSSLLPGRTGPDRRLGHQR